MEEEDKLEWDRERKYFIQWARCVRSEKMKAPK